LLSKKKHMDDSNGHSLNPWLSYLRTEFVLAFLIIFKWSHIYVCKDQCWPSWCFRGNVNAGSYVFSKMDDPFKEYFQRLKNPSVLGVMSNLFLTAGSRVWGLMVLNFVESRNIQKKVSPLLRETVVGMLIPILLLFNVYLMIYLNLYPTRAILEVQRFTIAIYIYVYLHY